MPIDRLRLGARRVQPERILETLSLVSQSLCYELNLTFTPSNVPVSSDTACIHPHACAHRALSQARCKQHACTISSGSNLLCCTRMLLVARLKKLCQLQNYHSMLDPLAEDQNASLRGQSWHQLAASLRANRWQIACTCENRHAYIPTFDPCSTLSPPGCEISSRT